MNAISRAVNMRGRSTSIVAAELLSIVLGLKPSARTEALVAPLLNR